MAAAFYLREAFLPPLLPREFRSSDLPRLVVAAGLLVRLLDLPWFVWPPRWPLWLLERLLGWFDSLLAPRLECLLDCPGPGNGFFLGVELSSGLSNESLNSLRTSL